jgi:hypothetical protein
MHARRDRRRIIMPRTHSCKIPTSHPIEIAMDATTFQL